MIKIVIINERLRREGNKEILTQTRYYKLFGVTIWKVKREAISVIREE